MAGAVSVLLILSAFFTIRRGSIDEIGLFNPSYMFVHYGGMSYPVYGYFQSMIVHPPVHYLLIGILMRLGMTLYYAQATPTLLMALLCVWLIVRGPFTAPVKIGLMYGLWVSMAVFVPFGYEFFGMRPEGHLGAAWLAGLVLLESGRLRNWNPKELFAGTLVLAYACSLHYYAAPAGLGVVVYGVWALASLRRRAWKPLLAMACGGLLYAGPLAEMFLLPHLPSILAFIKSTQSGGGIRDVLQVHLDQYAYWAKYKVGNFWLQIPDSLGIPLVLLSTPVLLTLRTARGIALAALPLELFLLLFAQHKHPYYFIHEVALCGAAVMAGSLTLADLLIKKVVFPAARAALWSAFGVLIAISFWNLHTWHRDLVISLVPQVHESEIARASGRAIIGPDAKVASRIGPWFSSGGRYWHDPTLDLDDGPDETFSDADLREYFSHFDAVVECTHMSSATRNKLHASLLTWYLSGILQLRGFYFGQHNPDLTNLFFQVKNPAPVAGFALSDDRLFRFDPASSGDHEFTTLVCSLEEANQRFLYRPLTAVMPLPQSSSSAGPQALVAFLSKRNDPRAIGIPGSRVVQQIPGKLVPLDWRKMVSELRANDPAMSFYEKVYQMPGYVGTGIR